MPPFGIQEVFFFCQQQALGFKHKPMFQFCNPKSTGSGVTHGELGLQCDVQRLQTFVFCCFMCSIIPSVPQKSSVFLAALERLLSSSHYTRARRRSLGFYTNLFAVPMLIRRHLAYSGPQGSCQISKGMEIQALIYLVSDCFASPVGFIYLDIRKMPTCTSGFYSLTNSFYINCLWRCHFCLSTAPSVFTKMLAPVLGLLRTLDNPIVGYLDDLPLRE